MYKITKIISPRDIVFVESYEHMNIIYLKINSHHLEFVVFHLCIAIKYKTKIHQSNILHCLKHKNQADPCSNFLNLHHKNSFTYPILLSSYSSIGRHIKYTRRICVHLVCSLQIVRKIPLEILIINQ